MLKRKGLVSILIAICVAILLLPVISADAEEVVIRFTDSGITVDGEAISTDSASPVYASEKTETHEDVAEELRDVKNTVVTITDAGTYRFSGTATDTQIAVSAGEDDKVTIVLDGLNVTCRTAPAIQIYTAYEPAAAGKAGVTLELAEGTENVVTGSHTAKTDADPVKHDGAISSNISLFIDGTGSLTVTGDKEGIEVKYKHLTIENGNLHVISDDDPVGASEDGVAVITINGGYLFCEAVGQEGDGIDSNGYITINDGTIIALACPTSGDSGLDSDMGTTINGGIVIGAGNMFDTLEENSEQLYMHLQFSESTDDLICITDEQDNPVLAYDFPHSYSYISFSTPILSEGTYHVYIGGTVEGTESDGLYTDITAYSGGKQMRHGGTKTEDGNRGMGGFGGMQPPEGMEFPEGMTPPEGMEMPEGAERPARPEGMEMPEGAERPARPEGMEMPEGMEFPQGMRPGGGRGPGGMGQSSESETYNFVLSAESRSFTNVTSAEISRGRFSDVKKGAWYFDTVEKAHEKGLIEGKTEDLFVPDDSVTGAEFITMLYRAKGNKTTESQGGHWYDESVEWGKKESILLDNDGFTFEADTALTREQMMVMLYRLMKDGTAADSADLSKFTDSAEISAYAQEAVRWLVQNGMIEGDGDTLRPHSSLSRAEAATILVRILEKQDTTTGTYPVVVSKEFYTEFSESKEDYFADGLKTGFGSAITFKGYDEDGNPQFYGVTDRGPSLDVPDDAELAESYDAAKIFPAPEFNPSIGVITVKDGQAVVESAITLKNTDGTPLSGLPLPEGQLGTTGETALDINLGELEGDANGFDPEGIAVDAEGNFWLADEYGPFLAKFNADGTLIQKYVPGDGLPEVLKYRIANRGFEGLSIAPSGKIYASVQSVLNVEGETSKTATFIRFLELDPTTGETKMYAYPVDLSQYKSPKNCKIGDIYAIEDNTLLVMEQGELSDGSMRNIVYKVDLSAATDLSSVSYNGREPEYAQNAEDLAGIMRYAVKEELVDLRKIGWTAEKAEGLCLTDDGNTLVLIVEDDFGLSGASVNPNAAEDGQPAVVLNEIGEENAAKIWMIDISNKE